MIPRPTEESLTWPTCETSSFLTQIERKIPTICLLATRQYFSWLQVLEISKSSAVKLVETSSPPSSSDESLVLIFGFLHMKHDCLFVLWAIPMGQLHDFSLIPCDILKLRFASFREDLGIPELGVFALESSESSVVRLE
jgi:hypothetical protein